MGKFPLQVLGAMKFKVIFVISLFFPTNSMIFNKMVHVKCRNGKYPFSEVQRLVFSDEKVPWSVKFQDYDPPDYNSKVIFNKPWADPLLEDKNFKPKWNRLDGKINRQSYAGEYKLSEGRPLNPEGRTGLKGRGILGKWGPNHAADPLVTRWKMIDNQKQLNSDTNMLILQFCAVQRKDCGQWALPGGMVDVGEQVSETLKREFLEEAMNSLETSKNQFEEDSKMIKAFFQNGTTVYKGYVDDPRNTDNAWMETVAVNFHDDDDRHVGKFDLRAGDDAQNVKWIDIDRKLDLYANHSSFIKIVVDRLKAHW